MQIIGDILAGLMIYAMAQTIVSGIRVNRRDRDMDDWRKTPPVRHIRRGGKMWEVIATDDGHELWTPLHKEQRR